MQLNIGTVKEPKHIWVPYFSAVSLTVRDVQTNQPDQELIDFLVSNLQKKCITDLRKVDNPEVAAKSWKPVFGKKKKTKVEKMAEAIKKLSLNDQNELKGLL